MVFICILDKVRRFIGERSQRMRNKRFIAAILSALLFVGQITADASTVYAQEKTGATDTSAYEVELLSEAEQAETDEPASGSESEQTEKTTTEETTEALSEQESEALTTEESSEVLEKESEELSSEGASEKETESSEEAEDKKDKDKIAEVEDTEGIHLNKYAELDPVALVGGSDGVIYDGVEYLSAGTVARFNDEMLEAYIEMCDTAADLIADLPESEEIGLYATESGELGMTFFVPFETYAEPENLIGEPKADTSETETVSETESEESVSSAAESESETETEEKVTETESAEESGESLSETETGSESEEEESLTESSEEAESEEAEGTDKEEKNAKVDEAGLRYEFIAEHAELAELYSSRQEEIEGDSFADIDSLFPANDVNFFRNNLTSIEKTVYDAGKKAMVNGGRNSFSFSGMAIGSSISTGLSALMTTYSSKFGWVDKSSKGGWSGYYVWRWGGGYTSYVSVKKSKYYSSKLQSNAKKKINQLVEEAYAYAGSKYPNAPTYGIVEYMNRWIVNNNYYNNNGVVHEAKSKAKDTAEYYYCHSPYGCLLKGYGVCESYAQAMSCLLDAAGVRNIYIVGNGGGDMHAWNYVKMPNNSNYYLLDPTWNDSYSEKSYFLTKGDSSHTPTGRFYSGLASNLRYPSLAGANYGSAADEKFTITFNKTTAYVKPKKSFKLTATVPADFKDFKLTWTSSNTKVAKVSKSGKVTTVAPGFAAITCSGPGKKATCNVYVYQFTGLAFSNNSKSSFSTVFTSTSDDIKASPVQTYVINVNQKNKPATAEAIKNNVGLKNVTAKSSKPKVAEVTSVVLSGDQITLKMKPNALGSTKVTVSFAGKKATLSLKVTRKIENSWFNGLPYTSVAYSGKANKPKVTKTASAPAKLTYKVIYTNNTNAGTATVTIRGTGNYGGDLTKTFAITRLPLNSDKGKFSKMTASAKYKAAGFKPSTTVKYGSKTLKAGRDYTVAYNGSTTLPVNVGNYTVKITGIGNYSGDIAQTKVFQVKPVSISKLSVSYRSTVKFTEGGAACPAPTVKIGKNVVPTNQYDVVIRDKSGKNHQLSEKLPKGKYKVVVTPKGSNIETTLTKKEITKSFTIK